MADHHMSSTDTHNDESSLLLTTLMKHSSITKKEILSKTSYSTSSTLNHSKDRWSHSNEYRQASHILDSSSSNELQITIQTLQTTWENPNSPRSHGNMNPFSRKLSRIRATIRVTVLMCLQQGLDKDCSNVCIELIQSMSKWLTLHLQQSPPPPQQHQHYINNEDNILWIAQVACHDILFEIHPLITQYGKAFLLPSVWRCLCDIFLYQTTFIMTRTREHLERVISRNVMIQGMCILISCLEDGEQTLRQTISTQQSPSQQQQIQQAEAHQRKLLVFLLVRLSSLYSSFKSLHDNKSKQEMSVITMIFECLAKLRDMGEQILNVGSKVDVTLLKTMGFESKSFIQLDYFTVPILNSLSKTTRYADSNSIFSTGKLLLQKTFLTKCMQINPSSFSKSQEEDFFEAIFSTCQSILHKSLPQCHSFLIQSSINKNNINTTIPNQTNPAQHSSILSNILCTLVDCTLKYKHSSHRKKYMIQTHYAMIQWLNASSSFPNNKNASFQQQPQLDSSSLCSFLQHPLSREVLLSVIGIHVMHFTRPSQDKSTRSNSMMAMKHLISLITSLVLDSRTKSNHAKLLSKALIRIGSLLYQQIQPYHQQQQQQQPLHIWKQEFDSIVYRIVVKHYLTNFHSDTMMSAATKSQLSLVNPPKCNRFVMLIPILQNLPSEQIWSNPSMASELRKFCGHVLVHSDFILEIQKKRQKHTLFYVILMISLLHASIKHSPHVDSSIYGQPQNNHSQIGQLETFFQQKTGAKLLHFHDAILKFLVQKSSTPSTATTTHQKVSPVFSSSIYTCLVRFIRTVQLKYGSSYPINCVQNICHLLSLPSSSSSFFSKKEQLQASKIVSPSMELSIRDTNSIVNISIENALMLGQIGKVITNQCPNQSLEVSLRGFLSYFIALHGIVPFNESKKSIASPIHCAFDIMSIFLAFFKQALVKAFNILLISSQWPIVAISMAAMETFATNLLSNHSWMIFKILPEDYQTWFQCRITGHVWDLDTKTSRSVSLFV